MFKAVYLLAVCVFLTVKAQEGEEVETNVLGQEVDGKQILALYERSDIRDAIKFEGDIIQDVQKHPCCPYRIDLITNIKQKEGICHVIFPISQNAYETTCLCDKCAKHCNNNPWYGCDAKRKIVKLYVCCHDAQICKIVYIAVRTGPCFCTKLISFPPLPKK